MKSENIQACATGCCLYVNGEAVSKEDFDKAAQSFGETRITCLVGEQAERVRKEAGFYIAVCVLGRLPDKPRPIYHPVTHQYLRDATPKDITDWQTARKKIIKTS